MIGVATQLAAHRNRWRGRAILAVQPAEEIGGGATAMIDDGLFERFGTPDVGVGAARHPCPRRVGAVQVRGGHDCERRVEDRDARSWRSRLSA